MKINPKIICAAAVLSVAVNSTAIGAVCTSRKSVSRVNNRYKVTYTITCGKSNKTAGQFEEKASETETKTASKPNTTVKEGASSSQTAASSEAYEVLALVNKYRKENGLSDLTMNENAVKAANVRAEEISRSFSHTRPDGRAFYTALDAVGITKGNRGENIASGYKTPADVMTAWMNSSGHRANILSKSYKEIGIGVYKDNTGRLNWVQLFVG